MLKCWLGKFWELKSTGLKDAEIEKDWFRPKFARRQYFGLQNEQINHKHKKKSYGKSLEKEGTKKCWRGIKWYNVM